MRKSPSLLALSVLLVAAQPLFSQEWAQGRARAEGTVHDEKGKPMEGVAVKLRWGQGGHGGPDVKTDAKGRWAYFGLMGGAWDIDFDAPGYVTRKIAVNLSEFQRNPPIDVELQPVPQAKPPEEQLLVGGHKVSKEAAAAIEAGNTAMEAKDYSGAAASYEKALAEMPDYTPLLIRLAAANYAAGKTDAALKYARQVVEKNPQEYSAWRMIAEIELQNGHLQAGREALAKVPEDKITDAQPYYNIGVLLINKKKYAEAELAISKAIAAQPDLAEAYYYRAITRIQTKKTAEAKADLRKYLELAPQGPDAKDVKDLLKSLQ